MNDAIAHTIHTDSWNHAVVNAHELARQTGLRYRVELGWAPYGNPWRLWIARPA